MPGGVYIKAHKEDVEIDLNEDLHDRGGRFSSEVAAAARLTSKDVDIAAPHAITTGGGSNEAGGRSYSTVSVSGNNKKKDSRLLLMTFVLMLFVGLGNKIFQKLMTLPMRNYPNFLNLLTCFIFIPVCFAYIIPAARSGYIPKEQIEMPKRPFFIMGALDAVAGIMSIFAATYLPGALIILLSQAAIPVSMIISRYLLKSQYSIWQYLGALTVAGGIFCVLAPSLSGGGASDGTNIPLWATVMILSAFPTALSSVYKEIALGQTEIDPMYLNGWVAVFQFAISLVLCVPSSLASNPPVPIPDLPANIWGGLKCFVGINTITDGDFPDNCSAAPAFVSIYLIFNQLYNILIILILKYGSANLLFMALTIMVPLGNVAFTLPFVPSNQPLKITDIAGLIIICSGLGLYRFAGEFFARMGWCGEKRRPSANYSTGDVKEGSKSQLITKLLLAADDEDDSSVIQ